MEYIVAMLVWTASAPATGLMSPAVIQGFQNIRVCEVAAGELKKQERILQTKCVQLPATMTAIEHGISADGSPLKKGP